MKIVVHHIGPSCVQCNQTKRVMDRLGIEYEEIDLRENQDLVDKFKELGHMAAPIVTAGERIWSGFRLEKIKDIAMKLDLEHAHD